MDRGSKSLHQVLKRHVHTPWPSSRRSRAPNRGAESPASRGSRMRRRPSSPGSAASIRVPCSAPATSSPILRSALLKSALPPGRITPFVNTSAARPSARQSPRKSRPAPPRGRVPFAGGSPSSGRRPSATGPGASIGASDSPLIPKGYLSIALPGRAGFLSLFLSIVGAELSPSSARSTPHVSLPLPCAIS